MKQSGPDSFSSPLALSPHISASLICSAEEHQTVAGDASMNEINEGRLFRILFCFGEISRKIIQWNYHLALNYFRERK